MHHQRQIKYHGKIKCTENCKESEVNYAAQCFKHKVLYIGHTGEQLSECSSKHCCNIKKWQNNTELAKHFYQIHKINDNFNVSILQNNIKTAAARMYHEDKRIYKLKNLAQHGLNTEIGDYFKVIIFYFLLIQ